MDAIRTGDAGARKRAMVWMAVLGIGLGLMPFDRAFAEWMREVRQPWMVGLANAVTELSKWHWLMLPFVVAGAWAWWRGRKAVFDACVAAVFAGSAAGVAANVFRPLFGRVRPSAAVEPGWYGPVRDGALELLDARYHAFPSGHATLATAVACAVWLVSGGGKRALLWFALPAVVGAARLVMVAHHPADVWAGCALGCAVALVLARRRPAGSGLAVPGRIGGRWRASGQGRSC